MPRFSLYLMVWLVGLADLRAATVADLQQDLAAAVKITIVDVRSPALFARSHIPSAINIPASLCPQQNLPPIGQVIVYDAGLAGDLAHPAAAALSAKPGIHAEILQGGYAAWQSSRAQTTLGHGLQPEIINYISYADVKAAKPSDVVLVDLRKPPPPTRQFVKVGADVLTGPPTDLAAEFPGVRVTKSAFAAAPSEQAVASGSGPLLVLIDSVDGSAEAVARQLKAAGNLHYAIVVGGELSVARHGRTGSQRVTTNYRQPPNGANQ